MEAVKELKTDRRRVWMVPVILIVVYAVIQAAAVALLPERDDSGSVVRGGLIDIAELQTSDCFNWVSDLNSGSIRQVDLQPCESSYQAMAVGGTMFPGVIATPWPGLDAIETYADEACPTQDARAMAVHIMPTEQTWADGDRAIVCIEVQ